VTSQAPAATRKEPPGPAASLMTSENHSPSAITEFAAEPNYVSVSPSELRNYVSADIEDGFGTSWLLPACPCGRPYDGIMQSDAIDVDSYLTQVPEGRCAVLTGIRDACCQRAGGCWRALPSP